MKISIISIYDYLLILSESCCKITLSIKDIK